MAKTQNYLSVWINVTNHLLNLATDLTSDFSAIKDTLKKKKKLL